MECRDIACRLHQFLDEDLPSEELIAFRAHVAQCPECQRRVAKARREDTLLPIAQIEVDPGPDFARRALARASAWRATRRRVRLGITGLAASMLLAVGLWWSRISQSPETVWTAIAVSEGTLHKSGDREGWHDLHENARIELGDSVCAGAAGLVRASLGTDVSVALNAGSEARFETDHLSLIEGALFLECHRPRPFYIESLGTYARVLGTAFGVRRRLREETVVEVLRGSVQFETAVGSQVVQPGQFAAARQDQAPPPPEAADTAWRLAWATQPERSDRASFRARQRGRMLVVDLRYTPAPWTKGTILWEVRNAREVTIASGSQRVAWDRCRYLRLPILLPKLPSGSHTAVVSFRCGAVTQEQRIGLTRAGSPSSAARGDQPEPSPRLDGTAILRTCIPLAFLGTLGDWIIDREIRFGFGPRRRPAPPPGGESVCLALNYHSSSRGVPCGAEAMLPSPIELPGRVRELRALVMHDGTNNELNAVMLDSRARRRCFVMTRLSKSAGTWSSERCKVALPSAVEGEALWFAGFAVRPVEGQPGLGPSASRGSRRASRVSVARPEALLELPEAESITVTTEAPYQSLRGPTMFESVLRNLTPSSRHVLVSYRVRTESGDETAALEHEMEIAGASEVRLPLRLPLGPGVYRLGTKLWPWGVVTPPHQTFSVKE